MGPGSQSSFIEGLNKLLCHHGTNLYLDPTTPDMFRSQGGPRHSVGIGSQWDFITVFGLDSSGRLSL